MEEQRLRICLLSSNTGIEDILRQIGISFFVADHAKGVSPFDASVLIVGREESSADLQLAKSFPEAGGAILDLGAASEMLTGIQAQKRMRNVLAPKAGVLDLPVSAFDVDAEVAHLGSGSDDWLKIDRMGIAPYCFLGLDIKVMESDRRTAFRRVGHFSGVKPAEEVSRCGHGAVPFLLAAILRRLCNERGLPFAHRWYHPGPHRTVTLFRLDTDFSDRDHIESYRTLIKKHGLKCTWFLHAGAHEKWLGLFRSFDEDEIALHCYRHFNSHDVNLMRSDIDKAVSIMKAAYLVPVGYAAPYGLYDSQIDAHLKANGISYRSDFGRAHDGLPVCENGLLQLPVHPISIGTLKSVKADESEMDLYFETSVQKLSRSFRPVALYDHPNHDLFVQSERMLGVLSALDGMRLTFREWAKFWNSRLSIPADPVLSVDGKIRDENTSDEFPLAVYLRNSHDVILQNRNDILTRLAVDLSVAEKSDDLIALRRFDLQAAKRGFLAKHFWRRTSPDREERMK